MSFLSTDMPVDDFRRRLVEWLEDPSAPEPNKTSDWGRRLGEVGLLAPDWPAKHGGSGLDRERVKILEAELKARGIRREVNGGLTMLGPVLREMASEEIQDRFLPAIARAEISWAQGYSEPQAGSDLANVQMRAEDSGDNYLVNGQKIWTSGANRSDWIFCLVRTDPEAGKHAGISFLLVDLRSPGVEIKPIVLISGSSPFCEVFFTDVLVPKANRVGDEGGGWPIAKRLLQHERSMLAGGGLASLTGRAPRATLQEIAVEKVGTDAEGRLADPALRENLARHLVTKRAQSLTAKRARGGDAARVSSILKLVGSETNQRRYELLMEMHGADAFAWDVESDPGTGEVPVTREWLRSRANTIEGGTTEVQINIIAQRVLKMPTS